VKAPAILVPDTAGQFSIVTISGAITVSISGFTISGPGSTSCGSLHYGILVKGGATAFIFGNSIVHIRDNEGGTISGCQNGAGIRVGRSFTSDSGTATVKGNSISDYQKTGIVVDGTGTQATVSGNTVTGVGPTPKIAQNGIQVGRGASGTISGNTVSGNECNHPTCGPDLDNQISDGGILLFNNLPGPLMVTVTDNNIFGNDIGVLPFSVTGGIKVTGNTITDNRFANVGLFTVNNILISQNTISTTSNTAAAPPCAVGSFCIGHSYTLGIDVLDSSTGNTISGNTVKVTADKFAVLLDQTATGNSVTCNSLSANHGATTGNAAVDDAGFGNTVKNNNGCCGEADGEGDFHGDHGNGHFAMDSDGCRDGDNDQVKMTNRGDGHDFQSTSINSVAFDPLTNTLTITGVGITSGLPVAFTLVAIETSLATPGWVSFVSSDGFSNAGPLTSGTILLH
jgi:hypothetical protein